MKFTYLYGSGSSVAVAAAALFAIGAQAHAQDVAVDTNATGLEEIVVTAQRRNESIQDIPVSVTAFSAQDLKRANIQDVGAYFQSTPNVFITDSPVRSGNNVSSSALGLALRGISNVGGNASSFGIYLDDFNISNIALNPHLIDMERIEVLRGPQGTYFGRNASGGVMSLNTQKPDMMEFMGEANAMVGRFGTYEIGGMVNIPLGDKVAVRAAGKLETSNGEFNNIVTGGGNGRDYKAARIALRAQPTDALTLDLSYNYTRERDDDFGLIHTGVLSDFIQSICPGATFTCPVDSSIGFYPENHRNYAHDAPLVVRNEYHIAVGRVAWVGEAVGVTSITGYGSAKFDRHGELDFSSVDFLREDFNYEKRKSFSQELRIQSVGATRFNWIAGAVYAQDRHKEGEFIAAGAQNDIGLPAGFVIELSHYTQKITSKAVFAEASFAVTDALSLTTGARYSHDTIKRYEDQIEFGGPFETIEGRRTFSDVSPRFAVKYAASDDLNFYGSVSKGWKSGGFELDPQRARSDFGSETLWNYEVGVKSSWFDNHLRANIALFYIDWSNVQVSSGVIGTDTDGNIINYSGISNAASATSKGFEIELQAVPARNLDVGLNIGYLNARFDTFTNARTNFGELDLSGKPLPKAPEWTLSGFAQYTMPVHDSFDAFVRGEYFYTDDAYTTVNNIAAVATGQPLFPYRVDAYTKVNLRVGVESDRFSITAYVENLFDKKYYTSSFDFGFANGAGVVPGLRRWGVRGSVKF